MKEPKTYNLSLPKAQKIERLNRRRFKKAEKYRKRKRAYYKRQNIIKYQIKPARRRYYDKLQKDSQGDKQKGDRMSIFSFIRLVLRRLNPAHWYKNWKIKKLIKEDEERK